MNGDELLILSLVQYGGGRGLNRHQAEPIARVVVAILAEDATALDALDEFDAELKRRGL